MKYWSLSHKLKLIQEKQNVDRMNGVFRVTFFSLSTLQVATCILGSWVFVKDYSMSGLNKTWIDTLAFVLTFLLPISCLFLFDAFRRMG
jgi:uncharacterized membrane protein